jgi:diguanylate cyclase (GGDEF)-like protein
MNVKDIAQDFNVYIFSQDVNLGVDIKLNLKNKNYKVDLFSNHDDLLTQFSLNPSHIVILDIASLIIPVHDMFERLLNISNEVRILIVSPPANLADLQSYADYNMYGAFSKNDENVTHYVCNACELITESLYRLYQNEHVLELYQNEKKEHEASIMTLEKERASTAVRPYQIRIAEYKSCQSKEELLDVFYKQASSQSWVYLKFIQTIETFISVSNHQVPEQWVEGLSYKVPASNKGFIEQIFQGSLPESFERYLINKFNVKQIKFIPLIIKNQIEGLMISTQDITADSAEDFSLMSLVYTNLVYETQPKHMDVEDQLTGFYNQLFYKRVLEKEIDRSKRTMSPLSVVKISIDKFIEMETAMGKPVVDDIIKKVAILIKQTSRLPDYICRTADNEFSLLLVNCGRKGAVIRSERLRDTLHKENYVMAGIRVSISQGISEYPTLAGDGVTLDVSAEKALKFIASKGGDKICLSKAQVEHQPDFAVNE